MRPLENGSFGLFDPPSLRGLHPESELRVDARVWSTRFEDESIAETIYVNARPGVEPQTFQSVLWVGSVLALLFVVVFLYAFTGGGNRLKNRIAFRVSYIVIFLSLGFPLVAPMVLHYLWRDLPEKMIGYPVGILVANVPNLDDKEAVQWVLNIGAHSIAKGQKYGVAEVQGGLVIPFYVFLLSILGGAINMTRQVPCLQRTMHEEESRSILTVGAGAIVDHFKAIFGRGRAAEGLPAAVAASGAERGGDSAADEGAGEPAAESLEAVSDAPPEGTKAGRPQAPSASSSAGSSGEGPPGTGDERGTPLEAEADHTMTWRKGLVDQYMYLLSAPFLAIVTYYLLVWLELTKVPVLVLVSFSVGLISDKIVRLITYRVESILGSPEPPTATPAAPEPGPVAPPAAGPGKPKTAVGAPPADA
jgi:hypothetical protein